jgi:hypothetical protein
MTTTYQRNDVQQKLQRVWLTPPFAAAWLEIAKSETNVKSALTRLDDYVRGLTNIEMLRCLEHPQSDYLLGILGVLQDVVIGRLNADEDTNTRLSGEPNEETDNLRDALDAIMFIQRELR